MVENWIEPGQSNLGISSNEMAFKLLELAKIQVVQDDPKWFGPLFVVLVQLVRSDHSGEVKSAPFKTS